MTAIRYLIAFLVALPVVLALAVVAGVAGIVIAVLGCFALLAGAVHWVHGHAHLP